MWAGRWESTFEGGGCSSSVRRARARPATSPTLAGSCSSWAWAAAAATARCAALAHLCVNRLVLQINHIHLLSDALQGWVGGWVGGWGAGEKAGGGRGVQAKGKGAWARGSGAPQPHLPPTHNTHPHTHTHAPAEQPLCRGLPGLHQHTQRPALRETPPSPPSPTHTHLQSSLCAEGCQVCAHIAVGVARHSLHVHVLIKLHVARVDAQHLQPPHLQQTTGGGGACACASVCECVCVGVRAQHLQPPHLWVEWVVGRQRKRRRGGGGRGKAQGCMCARVATRRRRRSPPSRPSLPSHARLVGHANVDLAIKAPKATQRWVDRVGAVGGWVWEGGARVVCARG